MNNSQGSTLIHLCLIKHLICWPGRHYFYVPSLICPADWLLWLFPPLAAAVPQCKQWMLSHKTRRWNFLWVFGKQKLNCRFIWQANAGQHLLLRQIRSKHTDVQIRSPKHYISLINCWLLCRRRVWWHLVIYMAIPESHAEEEFHTVPLQWEPAIQWEMAAAICSNVTETRQSLEGSSDRVKKKIRFWRTLPLTLRKQAGRETAACHFETETRTD